PRDARAGARRLGAGAAAAPRLDRRGPAEAGCAAHAAGDRVRLRELPARLRGPRLRGAAERVRGGQGALYVVPGRPAPRDRSRRPAPRAFPRPPRAGLLLVGGAGHEPAPRPPAAVVPRGAVPLRGAPLAGRGQEEVAVTL